MNARILNNLNARRKQNEKKPLIKFLKMEY